MAVSIALICVLGYLLGGINGAILLSKLVEKDDVRRHGSGNAGFTNFFRNYGKRTSLLVILIDAAKAAVSCLLGGWLLGKYGLGTEGMLLGGLAATLGHDFPAFLGFRGADGIPRGSSSYGTAHGSLSSQGRRSERRYTTPNGRAPALLFPARGALH